MGKDREEQRIMFHRSLPLGGLMGDGKLRPRMALLTQGLTKKRLPNTAAHPSGKTESLLGGVARPWVQSPVGAQDGDAEHCCRELGCGSQDVRCASLRSQNGESSSAPTSRAIPHHTLSVSKRGRQPLGISQI